MTSSGTARARRAGSEPFRNSPLLATQIAIEETIETLEDPEPQSEIRRDGSESVVIQSDHEMDMTREEEEARIANLRSKIERHELRKKEKAVQRRIEELSKTIQVRRELERQLEELQAENLDETENTSEGTPGTRIEQEDTRKRRRTDQGLTTRPIPMPPLAYGSTRKAHRLPTYQGKDLTEAQSFLARAERRFRQDRSGYFDSDEAKIDKCIEALDVKVERKWTGYEEEVGIGYTTWTQFKDFILGTI